MVNVLIYESSSFGGCYDYALELHRACLEEARIDGNRLLLPVSTSAEVGEKVLISDRVNSPKWFRKLHFTWRHLINPLILWQKLRNTAPSLVIFNDFEQLSAFVWVPLFKWLAGKHTYAVVLHDPDRDAYPPNRWLSRKSMKSLMSLMDFGFYHESLPDKPYYRSGKTKYINVPHGVYQLPDRDETLYQQLKKQKPVGATYLAILGNIREEKNYHLAIQLLQECPHIHLIIAGEVAHSGVDIEGYKAITRSLEVAQRVTWINRFLSYEELSAVVEATDHVWLNYSGSFQSQSAIFNLVIPRRKPMLIADGSSAMARIASRYELGVLVKPDDLDASVEGMKRLVKEQFDGWDDYQADASWNRLAQLIVDQYQSLKP